MAAIEIKKNIPELALFKNNNNVDLSLALEVI